MIDAAKFALPVLKDGTIYPYGLAAGPDIATALRRFAAAIDAGEVRVLRVQCGSIAEPENICQSGVLLEYVTKVRG